MVLITNSLIAGIVFADNNNLPSYVGLKENQEVIWKTEFDDDPLEEYLEDCGYNESFVEEYVDSMLDGPFDTDVEGWRIYILKIYEEEERDYSGDDINYVDVLLNWYTTNKWDEKDWHTEEKNDNGNVVEYDKDAYLDAMYRSWGLMKFWVSKDVDWSELVDEFEDVMDDDHEDGSASVETTTLFFQKQKCGINTEWEPDFSSECENHESISRYSQDGILLYYEWSYDGDIIMKIELENAYLVENWWWIALIIGFSIIGIIIVVGVVAIVRKRSNVSKVKV